MATRSNYCKIKDGRYALIRHYNLDNTVELQFGACGPFEVLPESDIVEKLSEEQFWKLRELS